MITRVRRRPSLLVVVGVVVVVLVVSAGLARVYSSVSAERSGVTALVEAEARGDTTTMLDDLYRCRASAACRARVAADAASLHRAGRIAVLELTVSSSFPLGGNVGTARIAWQAPNTLPVTQCVRVRHAGNPITGFHVQLLEISVRIKTNGDCPRTF
ncbi:MAG: hypothetical protein QOJ25_714 [Solirubrobacteraceae bacterium]|jgi:hypothetical protein|nr:hypothetical protein [Solirubrobacteraceae bacterium]